jgi:hypothetical protein
MAQPEESALPKRIIQIIQTVVLHFRNIEGRKSLNAIYYIMCFEFEIPNKKNDKNLNMIDEELEVEPELEKSRRACYSVNKLNSPEII